jgi:predicted nucleotidyltransferase
MKIPKSNLPWLESGTIFLTRHGSHAYGTNTPTSDEDFKGVAIPPSQYFHGYLERFEQAEFKHQKDGLDVVIYDIRKFFKLAADCNPSIIEVLFTDEADHIITTKLGQRLLDNRELFISKKAKHTFSGYATSQLKKIRSHYRWLKNPPRAAPTREEFGLKDATMITQDQLLAAQSMIKKKIDKWNVPIDELDDAGRIAVQERFAEHLAEIQIGSENLERIAGNLLGFSDNFLDLLDKERLFKNRVEEWRSYQTWLETRNADRSKLEAKYGYDTKHGMHLVRLLRMGREILTTGKVITKRPDAKELLEIRNGAWGYEELVTWAEKQNAELDTLYRTSTAVPSAPDRVKLDTLCQILVEESLSSSCGMKLECGGDCMFRKYHNGPCLCEGDEDLEPGTCPA